jgi:cell wall-associated NlpC family hydrolase
MTTHWTTRYVGLPYRAGGRERDGLDCWGLIRLIYREQLGIDLPEIPGIVKGDQLSISREILDQCLSGWVEQPKPTELCAVGMTRKGAIHHGGVWTEADGGKIIHCWDGLPVVADIPRNLNLRGLRIVNFFLWHS